MQSAKKDKRKNCGRDRRIVYTALMEIRLYYWIYVYIVNKDMRIYAFSFSPLFTTTGDTADSARPERVDRRIN